MYMGLQGAFELIDGIVPSFGEKQSNLVTVMLRVFQLINILNTNRYNLYSTEKYSR